jgi:hypothetical protein
MQRPWPVAAPSEIPGWHRVENWRARRARGSSAHGRAVPDRRVVRRADARVGRRRHGRGRLARGALSHARGPLVKGEDSWDRRAVWLRFAGWILLSLEFALGADIIRTAIAPTWDDVGKLGAIAAIRTFLGFFLGRDLETVEEAEPRPSEAAEAAQ